MSIEAEPGAEIRTNYHEHLSTSELAVALQRVREMDLALDSKENDLKARLTAIDESRERLTTERQKLELVLSMKELTAATAVVPQPEERAEPSLPLPPAADPLPDSHSQEQAPTRHLKPASSTEPSAPEPAKPESEASAGQPARERDDTPEPLRPSRQELKLGTTATETAVDLSLRIDIDPAKTEEANHVAHDKYGETARIVELLPGASRMVINGTEVSISRPKAKPGPRAQRLDLLTFLLDNRGEAITASAITAGTGLSSPSSAVKTISEQLTDDDGKSIIGILPLGPRRAEYYVMDDVIIVDRQTPSNEERLPPLQPAVLPPSPAADRHPEQPKVPTGLTKEGLFIHDHKFSLTTSEREYLEILDTFSEPMGIGTIKQRLKSSESFGRDTEKVFDDLHVMHKLGMLNFHDDDREPTFEIARELPEDYYERPVVFFNGKDYPLDAIDQQVLQAFLAADQPLHPNDLARIIFGKEPQAVDRARLQPMIFSVKKYLYPAFIVNKTNGNLRNPNGRGFTISDEALPVVSEALEEMAKADASRQSRNSSQTLPISSNTEGVVAAELQSRDLSTMCRDIIPITNIDEVNAARLANLEEEGLTPLYATISQDGALISGNLILSLELGTRRELFNHLMNSSHNPITLEDLYYSGFDQEEVPTPGSLIPAKKLEEIERKVSRAIKTINKKSFDSLGINLIPCNTQNWTDIVFNPRLIFQYVN